MKIPAPVSTASSMRRARSAAPYHRESCETTLRTIRNRDSRTCQCASSVFPISSYCSGIASPNMKEVLGGFFWYRAGFLYLSIVKIS